MPRTSGGNVFVNISPQKTQTPSPQQSTDPFADEFGSIQTTTISSHTTHNKSSKNKSTVKKQSKYTLPLVKAEPNVTNNVEHLNETDIEFLAGSDSALKSLLQSQSQPIDIDSINTTLYRVVNAIQVANTTKERRQALSELIDILNSDSKFIYTIDYNSVQILNTENNADENGIVWNIIVEHVISDVVQQESFNLKTIHIDVWIHLRTLLQYAESTVHVCETVVETIYTCVIKGLNYIDKNVQLGDICSDILRIVLSHDTYAQSIGADSYLKLFSLYSESLLTDYKLNANANTINTFALIVQQYTGDYKQFIVKHVLPFYLKYFERSATNNTKMLNILNTLLEHNVMSIVSQHRVFLQNTLHQLFQSYTTQLSNRNEHLHYLYIACHDNTILPQYQKLDILSDTEYCRPIYKVLLGELQKETLFTFDEGHDTTKLVLNDTSYRLLYCCAHILPIYDNIEHTAHYDNNIQQSKRVKLEQVIVSAILNATYQPLTLPWLQFVYVLITANQSYITHTTDMYTTILNKLLTTLTVDNNALRCWSFACLSVLLDLNTSTDYKLQWSAVIQHICTKLLPQYKKSHLSRHNRVTRDNVLLLLAKISDTHILLPTDTHIWKHALQCTTLYITDTYNTDTSPIKREQRPVTIIDDVRSITPPIQNGHHTPTPTKTQTTTVSNGLSNVALSPHDIASITYIASYYNNIYTTGRTVDNSIDTTTLIHALLANPINNKHTDVQYSTTQRVANAVLSLLSIQPYDQLYISVEVPNQHTTTQQTHTFDIDSRKQQLHSAHHQPIAIKHTDDTAKHNSNALSDEAYETNIQIIITALHQAHDEQNRLITTVATTNALSTASVLLHYTIICLYLIQVNNNVQKYNNRFVELMAMFIDLYARVLPHVNATDHTDPLKRMLYHNNMFYAIQTNQALKLNLVSVMEYYTTQLIQLVYQHTNDKQPTSMLHLQKQTVIDDIQLQTIISVLYALQQYQIPFNEQHNNRLLKYVDNRIRLKKITTDWSYILPISALVCIDRFIQSDTDATNILGRHITYACKAAIAQTIQRRQTVQCIVMCYIQHIATAMYNKTVQLSDTDFNKMQNYTVQLYHTLSDDTVSHKIELNRLIRLQSMYAAQRVLLYQSVDLIDTVSHSMNDTSYRVRTSLAHMMCDIATTCDNDAIMTTIQINMSDFVEQRRTFTVHDNTEICNDESFLYTYMLTTTCIAQLNQTNERAILYMWLELWSQHTSVRPIIRTLLISMDDNTANDNTTHCEVVYRNIDILLFDWLHNGHQLQQFAYNMLMLDKSQQHSTTMPEIPYNEFLNQYAYCIVPIVILLNKQAELQAISELTHHTTTQLIEQCFEHCFAYFYALYAQPQEKQAVWTTAAANCLKLIYTHYTQEQFSNTFANRQAQIVCALIDLVVLNISNQLITRYTITELNTSLTQLANSEKSPTDALWLFKTEERIHAILTHIRYGYSSEQRTEPKQTYYALFNLFVNKCIGSKHHTDLAVCRTVINTYIAWLQHDDIVDNEHRNTICTDLLNYIQTVVKTPIQYPVTTGKDANADIDNNTARLIDTELGRIIRHVVNQVLQYTTQCSDQQHVASTVLLLRDLYKSAPSTLRTEMDLIDELPHGTLYNPLQVILHNHTVSDSLTNEIERFLYSCCSYSNQTIITVAMLRRLLLSLQTHCKQLNNLLARKPVITDTVNMTQYSQDTISQASQSSMSFGIENDSDQVTHTQQNIRQSSTDTDGYDLITKLISELLSMYNSNVGNEQIQLVSQCLGEIGAIDPYLINQDNNRLFVPSHMYEDKQEIDTRQILSRLQYIHFTATHKFQRVDLSKNMYAYNNKYHHQLILLLLDQLLQSCDADTVYETHQVLLKLFSHENTQANMMTAYRHLDSVTQLYLQPYIRITGLYSDHTHHDTPDNTDDGTVWSTANKTYDQWIRQLFAYLTTQHSDDTVLRMCSTVPTICNSTLYASVLLPYAIYNMIQQKNGVITKMIVDHINTLCIDGNILVTYTVPIVLSCLHYIHQQQVYIMSQPLTYSADERRKAELAAGSQLYTLIPEPRKKQDIYNYILQYVFQHLMWYDIVYAADKCGYTTTGLLFYEHYLYPTVNNTQYDMDQRNQLQQLQTSLYSHINDPDALYAVSNYQLMNSIELNKHTKQWSTVLQSYDTMLQYTDNNNNNSVYRLGVAESLHQLGCYNTMSVYANHTAEDRNSALINLQYDAAWRSMNYNDTTLLNNSTNITTELFSTSIYNALRQFSTAVETGNMLNSINSTIKQGQQSVAEQLKLLQPENSKLVFDSIIKLQMLNHINTAHHTIEHDSTSMIIERTNSGELVSEVSSEMHKLLYTSRQRLLMLADSFELVEPIIALHSVLLRTTSDITALCTHYVFASTLARESNYISHANNYMRQANLYLTETTPIQSAAIQYENTKNQWATNNVYMAVNSLERIAQQLHNSTIQLDTQAYKLRIDILCRLSDWMITSHASSAEHVNTYLQQAIALTEQYKQNVDTDTTILQYQQHKIQYHIAQFNDRLYESLFARTATYEYKKQQQRNTVTQQECQILADTIETPVVKDILTNKKQHKDYSMLFQKYQYLQKLKKELALDQQQSTEFQQQLQTTLYTAVQSYILCLQYGNKYNTLALHRLVALWFNHYAMQPCDTKQYQQKQQLMQQLTQIPVYKFIPLIYQIASRLGPIDSTKEFNDPNQLLFNRTVYTVYKQLLQQHPYHCLYQLYALTQASKFNRVQGRIDADVNEINAGRIAIAQRMINENTANENRLICIALNKLIKAYIDIGDKQFDRKIKYVFLKDTLLSKLTQQELNILPPATITIPIRIDGDYFIGQRNKNSVVVDTNKLTVMQAFDSKIVFASSGVNRPLIATVHCSNGTTVKQLIKPADDLRQDTVMEQLFKLCNDMLAIDSAASKRHLHIRTYNVIPLTPGVGLVEWVEHTQSLGDILTNNYSGLHNRYGQGKELHQHTNCLNIMYNATADTKVEQYKMVTHKFPPQMRHYFIEQYTSSVEWLNKRTTYTHSVAVSSMIGYIVGLGDRHMQNILIDQYTSEVIHIDLGVAFEAGKILKTPELVPFRLTRDIIDGFGIDGIQGRFKICCEQTLRVLRTNYQQILTVLDVLVHDPLYKWSLSTRKIHMLRPKDTTLLQQYDTIDLTDTNDATTTSNNVNKRTATQSSKSTDAQSAINAVKHAADQVEHVAEQSPTYVDTTDTGNAAAQRALVQVRNKLGIGSSDSNTFGSLSVEGQVQYLINEATDVNKLAVMYHGWAAWC